MSKAKAGIDWAVSRAEAEIDQTVNLTVNGMVTIIE